jgi:hypothetical protein
MQEYCEKAAATPPQTEPAATIEDRLMYMSLAQQYGLADEMEIGESSQSVQTNRARIPSLYNGSARERCQHPKVLGGGWYY